MQMLVSLLPSASSPVTWVTAVKLFQEYPR